jgi:hypothetical protein
VLAANTAVPEYSARIAWLPAGRSLTLIVATALLPGPAATGTVAMVVLPRLNVTLPPGVPAVPTSGVTVALSSTVCP